MAETSEQADSTIRCRTIGRLASVPTLVMASSSCCMCGLILLNGKGTF